MYVGNLKIFARPMRPCTELKKKMATKDSSPLQSDKISKDMGQNCDLVAPEGK